MRRSHPYRKTMLAISRRMQRSGYSVAYTKHGDHALGVPDPPAGAAWIAFTESKDCKGFAHALGLLGLEESVSKSGRTCFELPDGGAACVVESGDGTGYLYLSELGPVEETRAAKLGTLLETIRAPRASEPEPLTEARASRPGMTQFRDLTVRKKVVDQILKAIMQDIPIILTGQPGSGRIMIARRIAEMVKGPLRAPHYTVSMKGLIGTVRNGRYVEGELTMANQGVLLLDEGAEMRRPALEAIGQAVRLKQVQLPGMQEPRQADFHLVMTAPDASGAKRALKFMGLTKVATIHIAKGDLAVK